MNINGLKMNVTGSSTYPNGITSSSNIVLTGGKITDCKFTNAQALSGVDLSKMTIADVKIKAIPIFK